MSTSDNALTAVITHSKESPYGYIYAHKENGVMKVYVDGELKHEYPVSGIS